jgi:hypothetical protein
LDTPALSLTTSTTTNILLFSCGSVVACCFIIHHLLRSVVMWPHQLCVLLCAGRCSIFFELAPGGISKLLVVESLTNFIITTITITTITTTTYHQLTTIISTLLPHQFHYFNNNLLLPYPIYYHCWLLDLLQFSVKVVIEELTTWLSSWSSSTTTSERYQLTAPVAHPLLV